MSLDFTLYLSYSSFFDVFQKEIYQENLENYSAIQKKNLHSKRIKTFGSRVLKIFSIISEKLHQFFFTVANDDFPYGI